ncbi:hypothetical protein PoB_005802900 [Plakobranchus ocellatus]|uniref:Uncharacterized protein n=1 Tax=Plakobranchus ocellatus TaxID=259542 RepID=A0AAV4CK36_9GAST|nr:hypothetical protein PoB_005802900 [Plakobranchus ocellatus]
MANQSSALFFLVTFSVCLCEGLCFMESSRDLLTFCRDYVDIESCAHNNFDTNITLFDIFDLMITNVSMIEDVCQNNIMGLLSCIGPCILEFRTSTFSHLYSVCIYERWIEWEESCWTEQWGVEARQCYRWLYPHHR